ncbi:hypothetical protein [Staphylospora marina]|uniref:hypothetical protein n=1 Tax=Staphylospora marina TaxID=2490858 RepID=UPI000F5C17E8|nr:hypothetical protein [Staphylospora marina]
MIKKLVVSLGAFMLAFGMFFGAEAFAASYLGSGYWQTEDGKWDFTLSTTSSEPNVQLSIWAVDRININNGVKSPQDDFSPLSVRLCNASTGNCTAYKSFASGVVYFTNMKAGTYYVDIVDSWPNYRFEGLIDVYRY